MCATASCSSAPTLLALHCILRGRLNLKKLASRLAMTDGSLLTNYNPMNISLSRLAASCGCHASTPLSLFSRYKYAGILAVKQRQKSNIVKDKKIQYIEMKNKTNCNQGF
jgi:hypothetical protein